MGKWSPAAVMSVFKTNQPCNREVMFLRSDGFSSESVRIPLTPLRHWNWIPERAAPAPPSKLLGVEDNSMITHPWLGMGFDGQLIRHRPGRNKKRGLFSKKMGYLFLKSVYSRVFPKDVISYFCFCHRVSHGRSRSGEVSLLRSIKFSSFLQKRLLRSLGTDMIWFPSEPL